MSFMSKWIDLHIRFKKNITIDQHLQELIRNEKRHWKDVLLRVVSVTRYLAEQNLTFRGKSKRINMENNRSFLSLVEMIVE